MEERLKLNTEDFVIHNQTKYAFDKMFERYEFWKMNDEVILFWQPLKWRVDDNTNKTLYDIVENLLEHDGIKVDSHCYISLDIPFDDVFFSNREKDFT